MGSILTGLKNTISWRPRAKPAVPFSVRFKKFKAILERNNRILELMADMGDKLGGEYVFDRQYIFDSCERMNEQVFKLISDLCVLNQRKNTDLFIAFERIQHEIQEEMAGRHTFPMVKPVILLDEIGNDQHDEVGNKFACLGDIRNTLNLPATDGFVVTTKTFFDFMEHNGLFDYIHKAMSGWDGREPGILPGDDSGRAAAHHRSRDAAFSAFPYQCRTGHLLDAIRGEVTAVRREEQRVGGGG